MSAGTGARGVGAGALNTVDAGLAWASRWSSWARICSNWVSRDATSLEATGCAKEAGTGAGCKKRGRGTGVVGTAGEVGIPLGA